MDTGTFLALGIMVGVMFAAWFLSRKANKNEYEYDEMQLKIRARGYQIGFYTALMLMLALILLWELGWLTFATPGLAVFAALLISVTVFAVYCILNDAFLSIRGKANRYYGIFGLILAIEGLVCVRRISEGKILEDGKFTFDSGVPVVMFICYLIILITLIVKTVCKREAEE